MTGDLPRSGAIRDGAHRFPVRVYYEDTDAAGLVYYANHLKYAERARTELLRLAGFEQERLRQETGMVFVVRYCTLDYRAAARLDDDLVVATRVTGVGAATLDLAQEVRRGDDVLVAFDFRIACLGRAGRPQRLPPALRAALEEFTATQRPLGNDAAKPKTSGVIAQHAR
ncbi:MAG TPA: tol-pal system-associated acyl-CoA thioesterase [Stellaceae bacterium]|nr:tol-pal system-associated acyl-CoA thioesterase [Stellaceae bacterium]